MNQIRLAAVEQEIHLYVEEGVLCNKHALKAEKTMVVEYCSCARCLDVWINNNAVEEFKRSQR